MLELLNFKTENKFHLTFKDSTNIQTLHKFHTTYFTQQLKKSLRYKLSYHLAKPQCFLLHHLYIRFQSLASTFVPHRTQKPLPRPS